MYLDNDTEHAKHIETLKHRNNVRLVNGEIMKNGSKFEWVTCKSTLSQYSVDQHLKTKMHLDNVNPRSSFNDGKDKDITEDLQSSFTDSTVSKDNSGYCNTCNNRYNNNQYLIAYLHPVSRDPNRVSKYNKSEYINEIKLTKLPPPYDYYHLKKIQELIKIKY